MEPKLVFPSYEHEGMMKAYIEEMKKASSELNGVGLYNNFTHDYNGWIKREKEMHLGIHLNDGFVPGTTFLYVTDNEVIGTINIRHCLNGHLSKVGGHIGYSVNPKYRRLGHATKMLQEALVYCKQWEICPVLVTCNKENIGSRKTIEKCGGKLENEYYDEELEETILRFWIGE